MSSRSFWGYIARPSLTSNQLKPKTTPQTKLLFPQGLTMYWSPFERAHVFIYTLLSSPCSCRAPLGTAGLWPEDLPLPGSRHPGDSSESHVEVQNKFFPEASGLFLVLSARLGLTRGKKSKSKKRAHMLCLLPMHVWTLSLGPISPSRKLLLKIGNYLYKTKIGYKQ